MISIVETTITHIHVLMTKPVYLMSAFCTKQQSL